MALKGWVENVLNRFVLVLEIHRKTEDEDENDDDEEDENEEDMARQ